MSFMDRIIPIVDRTIDVLAQTQFVEDPIAGLRYSRATSIISSAYKRHGKILEAALVEGLRESNRHSVWQEDVFRVSRAADGLANSQSLDEASKSSLPYGEGMRTLQVDLLVFDNADGSIRAYEVKRGNGQFDAGKVRSIRRDLLCVQVLLKSYGEMMRLQPVNADARIIFYYGMRSIPRPWSLTKPELDEHFGFPLVEKVEAANDYFRTRLHDLLERA